MGKFDRGGGRAEFFGRDGFGRNNNNNNRFDRPRQDRPMFRATCSNCGKECQLPFRPTNDKPVYCDDCFAKMRGGRDSRDRRPDSRPRFGADRPQISRDNNGPLLDSINRKLDKILGLLQPQSSSPESVVTATPIEVSDKKPKEAKIVEKSVV